jgi:hypothetical protein
MTETETIYARVPVELKAAVDAYAQQHGKTMAGAVAELLRRGLELPAINDQPLVYDFHIELRPSGVYGSVIRHPQVSPRGDPKTVDGQRR